MEPTVRDFIGAIFEGAQGYIEFRLIGNGTSKQIFLTVTEALANWPAVEAKLLNLNKHGFNIYYGAQPRTAAIGDAAHVPLIYDLYADLDYKGPLVKQNCAPLRSFNLMPTFTIDSGHGYHLHWLLKEPVTPAEGEAVMRVIAQALAGDHTWDAPRVLRLPGTLNVKDPAAPVPCKIVNADTHRVYNAMDFEPLVHCAAGTQPAGKVPAKTQAAAQKASNPAVVKQPAPAAASVGAAGAAMPAAPPPSLVAYGNGHGFAMAMAQAVAPYWNAVQSTRHKLALGLAGLLRKDEVPEEGTAYIIAKVCALARDDEAQDRLTVVKTTYAADINSIAASSYIKEALGDERAKAFFRAYNTVIEHIPPPPLPRPKLPEFDLYACLPPGSVFEKYVMYANEKTDAPLQYHVATIATLAAAALGNRIRIPDFHGSRLFPNLYMLLVGPSSRYRKSTSINIVHGIAKAAKVPVYPNNTTVEQLYVKMAPNECEWREEEIKSGPNKGQKKRTATAWEGSPWGIIYHREFSNYLSSSAKSYMQGHRDFLTDLYDGIADREMASRETKTQGKHYITDPAISMLCAVTPSSMRDFVTKVDIKGGFLSRFFVCMYPADHTNRFGWYRKQQGDLDMAMEVANYLEAMTKISGDMDITAGAEALWVEFEKWISEKIKQIEGTPLAGLDSFLSRLLPMAIKLAMVYAWGTRLPAPFIDVQDMQPAIGFCKYSANALGHFFDAIRPDEGNRELRYQKQVLDAARGYVSRYGTGPIPHRTLLQNSNLDSEQFNRAAESLAAEGRFTQARTGSGRGKAYILNEKDE